MAVKTSTRSKDHPTAKRSSGELSIDGWRYENIGRLLNNAVNRFEARVLEFMSRSGHPEARMSHLSLTRYLDVDGTRVSELARRAGMTKQAMGELVGHGEALDLVVVSVDPADKRARVVRFTPHGLRWLEAFRQAVVAAEGEMTDDVGEKTMAALKTALGRYGAGVDTLSKK